MVGEASLGRQVTNRQLERIAEQFGESRANHEQLRRELDELRTALSLQQSASERSQDPESLIAPIRQRLEAIEQRIASESERDRRTAEEIAEHGHARGVADQRIEALEGRVVAFAETAAGERAEQTRVTAALPELAGSVEEINARLTATRAAVRRAEDGLARLETSIGREEELIEAVEQARSVRIRLEERLRLIEERLQELAELLGSGVEERLALRYQVQGMDERMSRFTEMLDLQWESIIDHFRRLLDAQEQQAQRQVDEIQRSVRRERSLLVRLRESGPRAGEEESS